MTAVVIDSRNAASSLLSGILIGKSVLLSSGVIFALQEMGDKPFTNMDVAGSFGRYGFEPNDLWVRQEAANRLMQRLRKAGLASFAKKRWTAAPELPTAVASARRILGMI